MIKMFHKKYNFLVDVYHFYDDKTALIFNPYLASKQNGNGWEKTKINVLIPEEYYNEFSKDFVSKSQRNMIKKRLTLTSAVWTCTDGEDFTDCDAAIAHEKEIMEKEETSGESDSDEIKGETVCHEYNT